MMDIKKLKYFLEIAETNNITKAAENLHISQPPLTYQLKALEEALGVVLFKRTTRNLEITEAGLKLKERAYQIIELMDITKKEVKEINDGQMKTIRIGFVASSSALLSPEHLICFHNTHPEIKFAMKEGNSHMVLDLLTHGMIDVGLVRTPFNGESYDVVYLELEPMIAVYNNNSFELADRLEMQDLKDMPLVLDKRFSPLIEQTCHQNGIVPNIICEGEDSRSILAWTTAGLGVALLPYSGKHFIKNDALKYSIINSKALETRSAIVTLKNKAEKSYIDDFIKIINKNR